MEATEGGKVAGRAAVAYEASITFSGNPLDRVNNRRKDVAFLEGLLTNPTSLCVPFRRLSPLLSAASSEPTARREIRWKKLSEVVASGVSVGDVVLLGLRDGVAHYAAELSSEESARALAEAAQEGDGGQRAAEFVDMRRVSPFLIHEEAGILAQARALLEWHAKHRFCGLCGSPSVPIEGGAKRQCTASSSSSSSSSSPSSSSAPRGCTNREYPRTNPVVIMLVIHPDGRQCLLATQSRVAGLTNMWSCLAGFMDPGETIEEAVRREVKEESGVEVGPVHYFASQPWPFGTELMIGCFAYATKADLDIDRKEIADAAWFTPQQIAKGVRDSAEKPGHMWSSTEWRIPPKSAIAHQLMAKWLTMIDSPSSL